MNSPFKRAIVVFPEKEREKHDFIKRNFTHFDSYIHAIILQVKTSNNHQLPDIHILMTHLSKILIVFIRGPLLQIRLISEVYGKAVKAVYPQK